MRSIAKHALINGRVRTMDSDCSLAEAVLIAGDRIESVGSTQEVLAAAGPDAAITDLDGKALFPGFIDTHSHLSMYSAWSEHVYCGVEVESVQGALGRLAARARGLKPGELVFGWGFDDSGLSDNRGPTRQELDAVAPDHPVLVVHISVHLAYAKTRALRLAGLIAQDGRPEHVDGGEVVSDGNGQAQGLLREMAAFKAMEALCPKMTPELLRKALLSGIAGYNAYGITSTHEAGVGLGGIQAPMYMRVLGKMEKDGALNTRLYLSFLPEDFKHYAASGMTTGFGGRMLRICGPKLFNDGSIQAYTAALGEPYFDRPDHKPDTLIPTAEITEQLIAYHRDGYQIAYHGNGDVGIEVMIAAMEKAQELYPREDPRHILLHCQTASDAQLARMKKVGIVPSFFGLHIWYYGDRHYETFLGPERAGRLDPSGSAVRLGMRHSLHADSPVMPPWTLQSIHTSVNRITRKGRLLGGDQRISVEEAVRAYTSHAAWFQFAEHELGSIEPGKYADFVLLSDDLLAMDPERIADAKVLMTMLGGRVVHGGLPHCEKFSSNQNR